MSTSYSAGQYNQEFASKRMQMHQVPKANLSRDPKQRTEELSFIANNKGHLLPGVSRSSGNPFGDFVGTWEMPKSIPGPYHLVRTGRSNNNVEKIHGKKLSTEQAINEARENQKPLALKKNTGRYEN